MRFWPTTKLSPLPAPKSKSRSRGKQRGQGMTEYIIIVALVAIGAILVVTVFGDNIRALFGASANALTGPENMAAPTGTTVDEDSMKKDLSNFSAPP